MDIKKLGNEIQYGGIILSNGNETWLVPLPNELDNITNNKPQICPHSFESVIRQTDIVETEIFDHDKQALVIVRKSQRKLDQTVSWQCFKRDNYTCRYCGNDSIPLTYDHVMLWEDGGPNTMENGITACKKCNKTRGNTKYPEWLESDYYKKVSADLPMLYKLWNSDVLSKCDKIEKRVSKRKR